jgi:CheY-like chemotaxis protein
MSPEVLARLFEPYFTTKTLSRGAGLGLSIAQTILHDQGGWIEAESDVAKGSRLHVFLPEAARQTAPDATALHDFVRTETRALEGKETVLIVDDEEMVRLVIKAVLSYRGYQIIESVDGENMFELLAQRTEPVDLILMDVDMPRLNGWEALRRLKTTRPEARVIMLSGGAVDSDAQHAKERGAAGFLGKPFKNDQLVQLVRKTLDEGKPAGGS